MLTLCAATVTDHCTPKHKYDWERLPHVCLAWATPETTGSSASGLTRQGIQGVRVTRRHSQPQKCCFEAWSALFQHVFAAGGRSLQNKTFPTLATSGSGTAETLEAACGFGDADRFLNFGPAGSVSAQTNVADVRHCCKLAIPVWRWCNTVFAEMHIFF